MKPELTPDQEQQRIQSMTQHFNTVVSGLTLTDTPHTIARTNQQIAERASSRNESNRVKWEQFRKAFEKAYQRGFLHREDWENPNHVGALNHRIRKIWGISDPREMMEIEDSIDQTPTQIHPFPFDLEPYRERLIEGWERHMGTHFPEGELIDLSTIYEDGEYTLDSYNSRGSFGSAKAYLCNVFAFYGRDPRGFPQEGYLWDRRFDDDGMLIFMRIYEQNHRDRLYVHTHPNLEELYSGLCGYYDVEPEIITPNEIILPVSADEFDESIEQFNKLTRQVKMIKLVLDQSQSNERPYIVLPTLPDTAYRLLRATLDEAILTPDRYNTPLDKPNELRTFDYRLDYSSPRFTFYPCCVNEVDLTAVELDKRNCELLLAFIRKIEQGEISLD